MGRRNRRVVETPRGGAAGGSRLLGTAAAAADRVEDWGGAAYYVRSVRGADAGGPYRCPGCDQLVPPATPHVLAWPAQALDRAGMRDRRHWHTPCWAARNRRAPGGRW